MALKFQSIYAQLQARIVSGQWPEGYRIPTEMELCQLFAVSRVTIRRALDGLVQHGYLERARGRGSYVKFQRTVLGAPLLQIQQEEGFYRLLVKEQQKATDIDVRRLNIEEEESEKLWHLRTLYYRDGKPTSLGDYYISPRFEEHVANLDNEFTLSICSHIAAALGQQSYSVEGRIAAILPCAESMKLLEIEERRASLWWRAYCSLEDGALIGRCSKIYNGIDYEFALERGVGAQLV